MSSESDLDPDKLTQASNAEPPKAQLSPTQVGVVQLLDYVRVLIELADKPVWSLASYGNLVLHEQQLRNRIGIKHDLTDADCPVYLKVDRLRRVDPPEPPPGAKDWLALGAIHSQAVYILPQLVMRACPLARYIF